MELKVQKRLAASVLKCSESNVWFDGSRLDEIKEAITKADLRALASKGAIQVKHSKFKSRSGSRHNHAQKVKGRQKGHGSRKGRKTARTPAKRTWINTIRSQRRFLRSLKKGSLVSKKDYRELYNKSKGGFFRSIRHIKVFIDERNLIIKKENRKK